MNNQVISKIAKATKYGEKVLDKIISLLIILLIVFGGLGLYDAYKVYSNARPSELVMKYKPTLQKDKNKANLSLQELIALNPDVKAWLTIPNTKIDYPIVQGRDNQEYINKSVMGEYAISGSLFLNYKNNPHFEDKYSLIYGHHMSGEYMFGELPRWQERKYFDSHTKGYLFLPEKTYEIEFFAIIETTAFDRNCFDSTKIQTDEDLDGLVKYIKGKAIQFKDVKWTPTDKLIALSTCYTGSTDGRVIVFGKLY